MTGILTVSTIGSDFDTLLGVYTGTNVANLTNAVDPEAADDDVDGLLASKSTLNVVSNQTYFIAVDGYGRAEGNIILNLDIIPSSEILPVVLLRTASQVVSPAQTVLLSTFFTATSSADLAEVRWFRDGIDTGMNSNIFGNLRVDNTTVGSYFVRVKTKRGLDIKLRPTILQINYTISNNIPFLDTNQFTLDKFFDAIDKSTNGLTLNAAPPTAPGSGLILESLDPSLETGPASGYTSTQVFSTSSSTKEAGEPNHCGIIGGASEWFSYQTPTTGYSNPYLRINTDGSSFPTILAVYTNAAPGTSFTNLVSIACDSGHATNGNGSGVYFKAVPGALYYIAIDGVNGAKGSAQLNIFYGDPVVASGPTNQMASVGMTASFVATTSGSGTPAFQWAKNGQMIPGATTYRFDLLNVGLADAGTYSVQVSNVVSMVTNSATLSLSGPPAIISQPSGQTITAGLDVTMNIQATGSNPLTYQWRVNGANISGATNSALLITNVNAGDTGNYLVVIANSFGSITSAVAALTVNTPPSITTQPVSRSGAAGSSVSLNVTAAGSPIPAYQWQTRGTNVPGATGATLTISNFQTLNEGSYLVIVTNSLGSVVSSKATLYVNSPLRLNSSAVAGIAGFSFQLIGVGGSNYIFQASTNLTTWTSLLTNNDPNGILVFTDPASTGFQRRFYRVQPGP